MTDLNHQARRLQAALQLRLPPVAMALCDDPPAGVEPFTGLVSAGCAFWERAAAGAFSTDAGDHALCSIGVHTHNLAGAPPSQGDELQATLQAMMGLDYVRQEEVAAIPVLQRTARHVVYGPLAGFPLSPDAVILFADARQGLVLSEAVTRVDGGLPPAMGRPACAVIPQVVNQGRAAMSLGCCGARAYLDGLSDGVALWALPGSGLAAYCGEVAGLAGANRTLATFHDLRRRDVEAGQRPSVADSLARLSSS